MEKERENEIWHLDKMEVETEGREAVISRPQESCPIGNWSLFTSTDPGEQGLIRLIKEIRGTMSSLRDARVANLDCRLIKKRKKKTPFLEPI